MQGRVLAACAVALALVVIGCGGSGALTKADFTQKAEAVCRQAMREFASGKGTNPEQFAARFLAFQRAKADGIGKLKPPKELQAGYDQYLRAVSGMSNLFQQAVVALHAKSSTASIEAQTGPMQHREEVLASTLGLNGCVEHLPHGRRP